MATAVVSGRVDEAVRQRADAAMRKAGLTPSDVIQSIWAHMASTGEVPEIAQPANQPSSKQEALGRLRVFLSSLPSANPAYEGWSDDDILALQVREELDRV